MKKNEKINILLSKTQKILADVGLPLNSSKRRVEKMSMAILSLLDIKKERDFINAKSINNKWQLGTREIIRYLNKNFEEDIADSSYDDIRRKDLVAPVAAGIIIKAALNPNADTNDGNRKYAAIEEFANLFRNFENKSYATLLMKFKSKMPSLVDEINKEREQRKIPIIINSTKEIKLDSGPHNLIQKAIIEEFLPRFGFGSRVLYIGDTSEKILWKDKAYIDNLKLKIPDRGRLPDILAYSEKKNWLYIIEAVHTSNPIDSLRYLELKKIFKKANMGLVFISAFLDLAAFRKFSNQLSWETEAWIADNPSHMIHFNGDKFFGPR